MSGADRVGGRQAARGAAGRSGPGAPAAPPWLAEERAVRDALDDLVRSQSELRAFILRESRRLILEQQGAVPAEVARRYVAGVPEAVPAPAGGPPARRGSGADHVDPLLLADYVSVPAEMRQRHDERVQAFLRRLDAYGEARARPAAPAAPSPDVGWISDAWDWAQALYLEVGFATTRDDFDLVDRLRGRAYVLVERAVWDAFGMLKTAADAARRRPGQAEAAGALATARAVLDANLLELDRLDPLQAAPVQAEVAKRLQALE
jgi:hypothetical protein